MSVAEMFRADLRKGTAEAIRRVRFVALTTQDPRVQREALEYLSIHKQGI